KPNRVFRSRNQVAIGHPAQRQDQLVVRQHVSVTPGRMAREDGPRIEIDYLDIRLYEPRFFEHATNWIYRMSWLKHPAARFNNKRRHQKIIVTTDQRNLDARMIAKMLLQPPSGVKPAKTPAQHHNALPGPQFLGFPLVAPQLLAIHRTGVAFLLRRRAGQSRLISYSC